MAEGHYSSSSHPQPPMSLHLCFLFLILLMFLGFSWYLNYESVLESLFDQVKMVLVVSPLLLLLVVHFLSNDERRRFSYIIPLPERDSVHRAGGTPWGLGAVLVVLFFMISYRSSFQERLFPHLSR
ncbi:hypothetical protein CJ030_MR1G008852 [Morella rubra]|uniref:Uncharacterized protein n=1 Tax=Morella rubra TaxID=262757 RepID=A0A6A1WI95_9ROSI|nr:hypothetical protein CJ030_MR1G008852 [Morella rubra]